MSDEENDLVGSSFSLVRYNNPILIDKKTDDSLLSIQSPRQKDGQRPKSASDAQGSEGSTLKASVKIWEH